MTEIIFSIIISFVGAILCDFWIIYIKLGKINDI